MNLSLSPSHCFMLLRLSFTTTTPDCLASLNFFYKYKINQKNKTTFMENDVLTVLEVTTSSLIWWFDTEGSGEMVRPAVNKKRSRFQRKAGAQLGAPLLQFSAPLFYFAGKPAFLELTPFLTTPLCINHQWLTDSTRNFSATSASRNMLHHLIGCWDSLLSFCA